MPVKSAKTQSRAKRSKAEIQQEFAEIQEQVESARESKDAKAEAAAQLHDTDVRQATESTTIESVVQRISTLGLDIRKALAEVSEQLGQEVKQLATLREAVDLGQKDLERVHKIDVAATALDQMVQDYAHEKQRLEAEIASQRRAWEEETAETERERREQEDGLKKQRQREIEDYEYKKALERKKAQDKYEEEVHATAKKNSERQEEMEKGWQQRETVLKEREEELAKLRKEMEGLPGRIQSETEAASARAKREAEASFAEQLLILTKDTETARLLAEMRVKSLQETLAGQTGQIAALERQLAEAKQQVQDIAVKAIEGASGAKTLTHINEIAMEQAKNRPQG